MWQKQVELAKYCRLVNLNDKAFVLQCKQAMCMHSSITSYIHNLANSLSMLLPPLFWTSGYMPRRHANNRSGSPHNDY